MKIRGSAADRNIECSASLVEPDVVVDEDSPLARLGSARHEALSYIPLGMEPPVQEIADRDFVSADDIWLAVHIGRQAWEKYGHLFPDAKTEVRLVGTVTQGTADVLSVSEGIAALDWKTGYGTAQHPNQLLSYVAAAVDSYGWPEGADTVLGVEVHTAHQEANVHHFSKAHVEGFVERAHRSIVEAHLKKPPHNPGSWCGFCPRKHECGAYPAWLRLNSALLASVEPTAISREQLGELFDRSKVIAQALAEYNRLLDIELAHGDIHLPDGSVLTRKPVEKSVLDASVVGDVLADEFDLNFDDIMSCMKVTKSALNDLLGSKAPDRMKGKWQKKALQIIDDNGGVTKRREYHKKLVKA